MPTAAGEVVAATSFAELCATAESGESQVGPEDYLTYPWGLLDPAARASLSVDDADAPWADIVAEPRGRPLPDDARLHPTLALYLLDSSDDLPAAVLLGGPSNLTEAMYATDIGLQLGGSCNPPAYVTDELTAYLADRSPDLPLLDAFLDAADATDANRDGSFAALDAWRYTRDGVGWNDVDDEHRFLDGFDTAEIPADVAETLERVEITLLYPASWIGTEASICTRIGVGHGSCHDLRTTSTTTAQIETWADTDPGADISFRLVTSTPERVETELLVANSVALIDDATDDTASVIEFLTDAASAEAIVELAETGGLEIDATAWPS